MRGNSPGKVRSPRSHAKTTAKPKVKVPMVWAASRNQVSGSWYIEGEVFSWVRIAKTLTELGAYGQDNVVVFPFPKKLAVPLSEDFPSAHIVPGRLPDLVLHPNGTEGSDNAAIISKYYADHPPYPARVDTEADWDHIRHPKDE